MDAIGANAALLSNDVVGRRLREAAPYEVPPPGALAFQRIFGDQLKFAETGPLDQAVAIGHGEVIPNGTRQPESRRVASLALLATEFRVSHKAAITASSNRNDQVAEQLRTASDALRYRFWQIWETGDSETNEDEFDGTRKLVRPERSFDLAGQTVTLQDLARAMQLLRARRPAIMVTPEGHRAIHAAHTNCGLAPSYVELRERARNGDWVWKRRMEFDGALVYVNDLMESRGVQEGVVGDPLSREDARQTEGYELASDIYFYDADPHEGLRAIVPADSPGIRAWWTISPDGAERIVHVVWGVGLALAGSAGLVSIRNGVIARPFK